MKKRPLTFIFFLIVVASGLLSSTLRAAISVSGVSDKEVYADSVSFVVQQAAGYDITAELNGREVPVGRQVVVDKADYYELFVRAVDQSSGGEETRLIRFIVKASERGNSEWGLPPWVLYPPVPSAAAEFSGSHLVVITPSSYPEGLGIPLVVWVENDSGERVGVNGTLSSEELPALSVPILRGVGSGILASQQPGDFSFTARLGPLTAEVAIAIEQSSWQSVQGTLQGQITWAAGSRIEVTGDLTIPAGSHLLVEEGSVIALRPGVEINVRGEVEVTGSRENPVVFLPKIEGRPWGGFVVRGSSARVTMRGAIITGSGADPDWFDNNPGSGHSHRHEQCALYLDDGARAVLQDCAIVHNAGQAGHGEDSYLTMKRCLVQRCITAGQYNGGSVRLEGCALIGFPAYDEPFTDEDNDAFYLTGGNHYIIDSLLGFALDDGIDAGSGSGGTVEVKGCWIEACYHEGMAWSGGSSDNPRRPTVRDTVVLNCGQGIECGFGHALVEAQNIFSTANLVGARFGDNYDWSYDGFLRVVDSLLLFNRRNIWGRNWDDWNERLSQMDLHGNLLSEEDPLHPRNAVWDPARDAQRLIPFLPVPEGPVGVGIAVPFGKSAAELFEEGIPVRLSSFTTLQVVVSYRLETPGGGVQDGQVVFVPGQTVLIVQPESGSLEGSGVARLTLTGVENGELTGRTELVVVRPVVLIPRGGVWRYLDGGVNAGTAWRELGFDDSSWKQGRAELGYGDGDEATVIDGGPSGNRYPTAYFRHTFEVEDPSIFESLKIELKRDDGAVVYLNGTEVFRSNMPQGSITYNTWASGTTSNEDSYREAEIDPALLRPGENVIAVEVHQANATSSDLSFDLSLTAVPKPVFPHGFVRGDANGDGQLNISDAVQILLVLFAAKPTDCFDALDTNDSGDVNIADAVYLLSYLFAGGESPPPPFPIPGDDPTPDDLTCDRS